MSSLYLTLKTILDIIFPEFCAGCGGQLDTYQPGVCPACWRRVRGLSGEYCLQCGNSTISLDPKRRCENCRQGENLFIQAGCLGYFAPPLSTMIHRLKYGEGQLWLRYNQARFYADFLGERMASILPNRRHLCRSTVVVPVPIHPDKRRRRGFNQSELLAEAVARYSGWALNPTDLIRVLNTGSQTKLSSRERQENVRDAFAVRIDAAFTGERVLLIDDVLTTGSTANACAEKLLEAGARQVGLLTIARAGGNPGRLVSAQ